ncbi:hypothetical protein BDZ89DRAFT_1037951 [Hymenopellis radicata]|nr:hypothetical protein BDZ89DRAFT_1037951 [Hymenopellis radicata]
MAGHHSASSFHHHAERRRNTGRTRRYSDASWTPDDTSPDAQSDADEDNGLDMTAIQIKAGDDAQPASKAAANTDDPDNHARKGQDRVTGSVRVLAEVWRSVQRRRQETQSEAERIKNEDIEFVLGGATAKDDTHRRLNLVPKDDTPPVNADQVNADIEENMEPWRRGDALRLLQTYDAYYEDSGSVREPTPNSAEGTEGSAREESPPIVAPTISTWAGAEILVLGNADEDGYYPRSWDVLEQQAGHLWKKGLADGTLIRAATLCWNCDPTCIAIKRKHDEVAREVTIHPDRPKNVGDCCLIKPGMVNSSCLRCRLMGTNCSNKPGSCKDGEWSVYPLVVGPGERGEEDMENEMENVENDGDAYETLARSIRVEIGELKGESATHLVRVMALEKRVLALIVQLEALEEGNGDAMEMVLRWIGVVRSGVVEMTRIDRALRGYMLVLSDVLWSGVGILIRYPPCAVRDALPWCAWTERDTETLAHGAHGSRGIELTEKETSDKLNQK